jgi:hypothetical protein
MNKQSLLHSIRRSNFCPYRIRADHLRALFLLASAPVDLAFWWTVIRHLPPRAALAAVLVHARGLSLAQAARVMGCSRSAVRFSLRRAREAGRRLVAFGEVD